MTEWLRSRLPDSERGRIRLSPVISPAATAVPERATASAATATTIDADGRRPRTNFILAPTPSLFGRRRFSGFECFVNMRLTVVGHIEWVDFVPVERFHAQGQVIAAQGAFSSAGGAGAWWQGARRPRCEVDFYTALGRDPHGRARPPSWRTVASAPTSPGAISHPPRGRAPGRRRRAERSSRSASACIPRATTISTGAGIERSEGAYFTAGDAAALQRARAARVLTASPRGRGALDGTGPTLDALIFSELDSDERQWAERLESRARLLVATKGEEGGRWWGESSGTWPACRPPDEVRDAYGAGDWFAAGFTLALASGETVPLAARCGAECGAGR